MQHSFLILFFWDLLTIPKLKSPCLHCACWCTWSPYWVILFWSRLVSWILIYTHPCTSSSATCHVWTSGTLLLPWLQCWKILFQGKTPSHSQGVLLRCTSLWPWAPLSVCSCLQSPEILHHHEQEGLCSDCSWIVGDRILHCPGGNCVCVAAVTVWK